MSFDKKKLQAQIPSSFLEVYETLRFSGFIPTLVGGSVRDFLRTGTIGADWDLELTHPSIAFSKETWKDLGKRLSKMGKVSYLSYEIIRLDLKDVQYEFSPPRKEVFGSEWQTKGHSNFEAEFDFKLDFEEAVKRRDFTINAIGIRFSSSSEYELLDPLGGSLHLSQQILHPCGEDFQKDPVRFLRALRFSQKYKFSFSPTMKTLISSMPVKGLSANYIWSEMQKSGDPVKYYKTLTEWSQTKEDLGLPLSSHDLQGKWEDLQRVLKDPTKFESWIIALEWIGISGESWQKYFSISSETSTRLGRWASNSKAFINIKPEVFHGEFEEVREKAEFSLLFDWFFSTKQLLQKNPDLPLLYMIEEFLPEWIHLYQFEAVKDVKHIDPPLRAKYQVWNLCQRL